MLYREIIAVCSQIHTQSVNAVQGNNRCSFPDPHKNTLCGQNVELLNVEPGGTYSDHWDLEGYLRKLSLPPSSQCEPNHVELSGFSQQSPAEL
jgi:hypothetical protein